VNSAPPILCFGEAIVDLICEREGVSLAEAESFRPHFGGALANVAVACRRAEAPAALAGGAGDDPWGRWLREGLEAEGVDLRWFSLVPGAPTAVAFVTFERGEPRFQVYGEGIAAAMRSVAGRLAAAVGSAAGLVFGSNTLVRDPERALTLDARRLALELELPVLFDPNLRPTRWDRLDRAVEICRELCADAFVVRANREEATLLTGDADPAGAAEALCALGARLAVVTLGPDGALVRGEAEARAPGVDTDVVSTLGAGDAFMGTFAAGLANAGWDPTRAPEALRPAVEASAAACTTWGARHILGR
jgi:sugar/nucleoside kinase (ribokinase family)